MPDLTMIVTLLCLIVSEALPLIHSTQANGIVHLVLVVCNQIINQIKDPVPVPVATVDK
jgi:hypothetical protein